MYGCDVIDTESSEIDWDAGGIETELGWALPLTFQTFTRLGTEAVSAMPQGPRGYQVLVAITTEEPSSQLQLAQRLGIDKTQMTYLLDALEAEGLVSRRPAPTDRRVRHVHPTDAGRATLDTARAQLRQAEDRLLGTLDPDERATLRTLLARVAVAADAARTDPDFEHPVAAPERSRRGTSAPTDRTPS